MKAAPLLLIGAAGLGRESLAAIRAADEPTWTPLGFLDDDPATHGHLVDGVPVLGPAEAVSSYPDASVVLCVANVRRPAERHALTERLGLPPERYGSIVHPSADIAKGTAIGPGSILLARVTVTAAQGLGAHLVVMPNVVFTHDDRVGDFVTCAPAVCLSGFVTVGQSAFLGAGSVVRERVVIGARTVVAMGAVLLGDTGPDEIWAGNPARRLLDLELRRSGDEMADDDVLLPEILAFMDPAERARHLLATTETPASEDGDPA